MRALLLIISLLFATPAIAAGDGWQHFESPQFGFKLDIPPGFAAVPATTNTGDQFFNEIGGSGVLVVSGGTVQPGSFNKKWEATKAAYEAEGWALTYEPVAPHWTSFSGARESRRLYVKMLPICGGTKQYAMFALAYDAEQADAEQSIALRIADSMTRLGTGFSC